MVLIGLKFKKNIPNETLETNYQRKTLIDKIRSTDDEAKRFVCNHKSSKVKSRKILINRNWLQQTEISTLFAWFNTAEWLKCDFSYIFSNKLKFLGAKNGLEKPPTRFEIIQSRK